MKFQYFGLLLVIGAAAVHSSNTDVCGDIEPTKEMMNDPLKVIDYLRNLDTNKKAMEITHNNDWLKDLKAGKVSKDDMRDWIVQTAYTLQMDARSMGGGYNMFGFAYPVIESRMFFSEGMDISRDGLMKLTKLAHKFGIDDMEKLMEYEPEPLMMTFSHALAEGIVHAEHHCEIVAGLAVTSPDYHQVLQMMKKTLQTTSVYKQWGLSDDDLEFFDNFRMFDTQNKEFQDIVKGVVGRGLDQDVSICAMRRKLNNFNMGRILFWEKMSNMKPKQPKSVGLK